VWTHAVMDVGATLCKPRRPRCDDCPARPWCRYAGVAASVDPSAGGGEAAARAGDRAGRIVREVAPPFASTDRWLRGRILDRLRATEDGVWVTLEDGIGVHDGIRVRAAADALAADGIIELGPSPDGAVRARLALS
jgi:adenine-specific DNA glycosylase